MTGKNLLTIIDEGQTCIQVSIVTEKCFYKLIVELVVQEQSTIRFEEDSCSVFFCAILGDVAHQLSFLKRSLAHLSVAIARHLKTTAQSIHRLQTDTIQADALLERLGIVFTTGIQLADRLDELALRNTTTVVTNTYTQVVLDGHFYLLTSSHLELVDTVVHHFLQQHINTVVILLSVAQASDIHPRTHTDMLHVVQVTDIVVGIFYIRLDQFVVFFHGNIFSYEL